MNCSYFLRIFWCCLWGIIFEGSKFQFRKIVSGPRVSVRSLYKKKITVACPTDKGDAGRLNIVATKCCIVRMPLAEWICIRPGDGGTLTIVVNKCSIVWNAPCRMNMHPPRRWWYTNHHRQQVLHCQKCPLANEDASAPAPWPLPPSSPIWAPSPLPAYPSSSLRTCRTTPIRLEVHVRGEGFKVAGVAAITPSAWIQSVS
jgi:hypothetical protein